MEFWEPYESEEYDPYTDSNITKYKMKTVSEVDMQPYTPKESIREFGKILQNTFKIYTNIKCSENCILRISEDNVTYSIVGSPQYNNHFNKTTHYKLIITQERQTRTLKGE
jgi:hypothetical protein